MNPLPIESVSPADGLREAYFRQTQSLLLAGESRDDAWRTARGCLHQRGFDLRKVDQLPLGYFPSAEPIWHGLLHEGFSADEILASNLLTDSRLPGRLVGPIRDAQRQIISFWARRPQELDRSLYLSTEWKEQTGVFGLDVACPAVAGGRRDLLLVEDIWDSLLLQFHGCAAVGAIGNSPADISPRRWERLDELGIHRVTLVVDSFHDSHEACVAAIRQAACSRRGPAIYVLPPSAVHGAWQGWQQGRMAKAEGIEKLLRAHRIHGFHYLALGLIALHKGEGPWTDPARRDALDEAREFYVTAHQRNVPQLDAFFLPPLLDAVGLNWGDRAAWHDSWLEDTPSSNGSGWANSEPAAPEAKEPTEQANSEVAQQAPVPAPAPSEPEVAIETPTAASRALGPGSNDFCDFHQCDRIVCLCWD
jgi:hypothetical protein